MNKLVYIASLALLFIACGDKDDIKVPVEPTDKMITKYRDKDYSIVLNDMNVSEVNGSKKFEHKYHLLLVDNDSLTVDSLDWQTVNRSFFKKHENDLGMEIVSHHDGKLSRVARPVGFGWAVGNEKHGTWEAIDQAQDSTQTVANNQNKNTHHWRPSLGSGLFWYWMLSRRPAYRNHYNGFATASSRNQAYYGPKNGTRNTFGTNSSFQRKTRPNFFSRAKSSTTWKNYKSQTSSRSSRYKGGSSTRSRSGGIGK